MRLSSWLVAQFPAPLKHALRAASPLGERSSPQGRGELRDQPPPDRGQRKTRKAGPDESDPAENNTGQRLYRISARTM